MSWHDVIVFSVAAAIRFTVAIVLVSIVFHVMNHYWPVQRYQPVDITCWSCEETICTIWLPKGQPAPKLEHHCSVEKGIRDVSDYSERPDPARS